MKRIISLLIAVLVCVSFTVCAFAVTEANTENVTAPTVLSDNGEIVAKADVAEITEATTVAPENPSKADTELVVVSGYGLVAMSLEGANTNVTVIVESNGKSYELEFNADNNYIVQQSLPVGTYTIVSAKSSNEDYKIKECLTEDGKAEFTVVETDFMSVRFKATETKIPFIVGFLKREWYLLIVLAGLVIAYVYKRKTRVLPSQEH